MRKMTNKEAIEALKWKVEYAKEIGESYIDCVYVEALDLAIKALENQTTEGDCISRRVVKGLISGKSIPIKFEEEKRGEWRCSSGVLLSDMYKVIDNAPPIEPERPQGEWKVDDKIYCSECGESICDFIPNPNDAVALIWENKFCFNCGADMRKGGAE